MNAHVARPAWGGGAFFYCEPAHAVLIKENQHLLPFQLQSKHLVCSPQYEVALRDCLDDLCVGEPGREAYLKKKAGQIKDYHVVELPAYPMLDLTQVSSEHICPDLMDYLMAPSGVQTMVPETWDEVWQTVQGDEEALIETVWEEGKQVFRCTTCRNCTVMNLSHLCFSGCVSHFRPRVDPKSLFGAILKCAQESRPKVYVVGE